MAERGSPARIARFMELPPNMIKLPELDARLNDRCVRLPARAESNAYYFGGVVYDNAENVKKSVEFKKFWGWGFLWSTPEKAS